MKYKIISRKKAFERLFGLQVSIMNTRYDEKITRRLFFSMVPVQVMLVMCSGINFIIDGAFASILIAHGVDARTASAQLGHSSPALVYNTYVNSQESAKRESAELLGGIVFNKPENG